MNLAAVLDIFEALYGPQEPTWPTEPYEYLVWLHCGYPASDAACEKGWRRLTAEVGISPQQLLAAPLAQLTDILRVGGMVPELRAQRLQEIATRVQGELQGDLRKHLNRKVLKTFPNIADPGADRILLFAGEEAVPAVPSNCPHVLVRIRSGDEGTNYGATYREAQAIVRAETPETIESRQRAYLLLKQHGQILCKRTNPKCPQCPLRPNCAYFSQRDN